MGIIEIIGFTGALFIGLVLGLIGGGGSILTVPILVYLLAYNPVEGTAYSLFVVGISALTGTIKNLLQDMVDVKIAVTFAIPIFTGVYLTRRFLIPAIPEVLFKIGNFTLTKDMFIMLFFAIVMLIVSIKMITNKSKENKEGSKINYNYPLIIIEGLAIGVLTGIIGAGGGFLIVPALVLLAKLPMKRAVPTSLFIISISSLIGFVGDIPGLDIKWGFLLLFTGISIIGIFMGIWLNKFVNEEQLKKIFGWFVLSIGIYILYSEFL